MLAFTIRRLLALIPLLFLVSVITFGMIVLTPQNPAIQIAGPAATKQSVAQIEKSLGLTAPLLDQYWTWTRNALEGNLGRSVYSGAKVTTLIAGRLSVTLSLTLGAVIVSLLLGVPAGLFAAVRRGKRSDAAVRLASSGGISLPSYFLGMLLALFFAVELRIFPATGYVGPSQSIGSWVRSLVLPSIALGVATASVVARQLRSSMVAALEEDYVRTARAMGIREHTVVLKHALKNAATPVITVLGVQVAYLLGGAVVIESIFGLNGVGSLVVESVLKGDYPVVRGVVVFTTIIVVLVNLATDLICAYLAPQTRQR